MADHNNQREEVFSKSVRAGKRTYFFDVKSTKSQDYYLTITESKKKTGDDGNPFFEKHKIFLYREDFQKFMDGLSEAFQHVSTLKPLDSPSSHFHDNENNNTAGNSFSDVNFDDLGK